MASVSSSSSQDSIAPLEFTKPFQLKPIPIVPKYLFGNYNCKTCNNYNPKFFPLLRSRAQVIQPSEILGYKIEGPEKIQKAKEFDWIYGLDKLEEYLSNAEMLKGVLKVEDIMTMNGYLSRLTKDKDLRTKRELDHKPGNFRQYPVRINIKNLNTSEIKALPIIELIVCRRFKNENISNILNPSSKLITCFVKDSFLKLQLIKNEESLNIVPSMVNIAKSDSTSERNSLTIVREWTNKKGRIDLIKWLKDRMYYYPNPSEIKSELEKAVESIKDPKMHPIEKAAKIWFDIVRIKPFCIASKKTAKVIAFAILLSNGYLPPIIFGKEDQTALLDCFDNNIEENPHLKLTTFLSNQILKIQDKFKSDSRDISELSLFEKKES